MNSRKRDLLFLVYGFFVAAVCLLICSKSSPLYPINDWTDTNIFFSCGKGMLQGSVLYRDLYDHKGPLLYALYALCALISATGFFGVYLLETVAVGLFLFSVYKLLSLYGVKNSAWLLLPVLCAVIVSSDSFQQGGSAEELCLPILGWSLYALLGYIRSQAPTRMRAGQLFLQGVLCGAMLWIKFTLLGFFAAFLLGLFFYHLFRRQTRAAFACLGWFALGILASTLPWLVYFGVNGAIGDFLKTYLYDNIFLYSSRESLPWFAQLTAIARSGWRWFRDNLIYTAPMLLGGVWVLFSGRHSGKERVWIFLLFFATALGVFISGTSYPYYGLILAAFAGFALPAPGLLLDKLLHGRRLIVCCTATVVTLCSLAFCFAVSANTGDLLKPRSQTMQYQFVARTDAVQNATLLNYGFMDAGFYTASRITPSVKYFHLTNVPLEEMRSEQARYVREGVTDFVVSREPLPAALAARYQLIQTADAPDGFWYDAVYLYERSDLLPEH